MNLGPTPSKLANISTRSLVLTGPNAAVGGFIIGGTGTKQVLIRGFGPTLSSFGVAGALGNPTLDLEWDDDGNPNTPAILVLTNNDWGTALGSCPAPVVSCGTPQDILDTGMSADSYAPSNPNRGLDSALLLALPSGTYTARMSGVGGGTGVGLIGLDDVDASTTATLINISTRAFVGTGSNVVVGGFIVSGAIKQLLLRGFGPTLADFGVAGALANPTLELEWDDDSNPNTPAILILTNNNWGTALGSCPAPVLACGTPQDIFDTGMSADSYAPTNPNRALDAALLLTLPPGTYTARLSGVGGGTGVGLIGVDEMIP
jgi:Trk-type K+ transport system membrane component